MKLIKLFGRSNVHVEGCDGGDLRGGHVFLSGAREALHLEPIELVLLLLQLFEGLVDRGVILELLIRPVRLRTEVQRHLRQVLLRLFFVIFALRICIDHRHLLLRHLVELTVLPEEVADFLAVLDVPLVVEVLFRPVQAQNLWRDFAPDRDVVGALPVLGLISSLSHFLARGRLLLILRSVPGRLR